MPGVNLTRLTAATAAAVFAALSLTACGSSDTQAPASAPVQTATTAAEPAADTSTALVDNFTAATKGQTWAGKVSAVKLDGKAVIVWSTFTKTDKAATVAACEAATKAARDTKTDFQSVAVRSADDSTLAHQNEKYGPKQCEN
ncbi:hypothetical protein [Amycolatopsis sp. lyj-23]|uniref:hypothetical protein n=1 Tax=Amycolatopsis sp. lyj-23 TaxID=2789283 RepID=UPI00397AA254